jgi:hypothetical protein
MGGYDGRADVQDARVHGYGRPSSDTSAYDSRGDIPPPSSSLTLSSHVPIASHPHSSHHAY